MRRAREPTAERKRPRRGVSRELASAPERNTPFRLPGTRHLVLAAAVAASIHGRTHEPIAPRAILSRDSFPRALFRAFLRPPRSPVARSPRRPVPPEPSSGHPASPRSPPPKPTCTTPSASPPTPRPRRFAAPTAISSLRFAPSLDLPFPPRAKASSPRGVRASVPVRGRPPVARRDAFVSASDETPIPDLTFPVKRPSSRRTIPIRGRRRRLRRHSARVRRALRRGEAPTIRRDGHDREDGGGGAPGRFRRWRVRDRGVESEVRTESLADAIVKTEENKSSHTAGFEAWMRARVRMPFFRRRRHREADSPAKPTRPRLTRQSLPRPFRASQGDANMTFGVDDIIDTYGVVKGSYEEVSLPKIRAFCVDYVGGPARPAGVPRVPTRLGSDSPPSPSGSALDGAKFWSTFARFPSTPRTCIRIAARTRARCTHARRPSRRVRTASWAKCSRWARG